MIQYDTQKHWRRFVMAPTRPVAEMMSTKMAVPKRRHQYVMNYLYLGELFGTSIEIYQGYDLE